MKYIINLIIVVLLICLCNTAFALDENITQNTATEKKLTGEYSYVIINDIKINNENKKILITLFVENKNEKYITISPDIVFKKQQSVSKIQLEKDYEYILVPKKTTHIILKFNSDIFSDGIYNLFLNLKSEERLICEKQYFLKVNSSNFTLFKKNQNNEENLFQMPGINISSFFSKTILFLDNYGIYIVVVLFIIFFYRRNKRTILHDFEDYKYPKTIKRIKISSFAQKPFETKSNKVEKNNFSFTAQKAREELHELNKLKLKGWIDEKKYNLLKKKILLVADIEESGEISKGKKTCE